MSDGGPAFPCEVLTEVLPYGSCDDSRKLVAHGGMSLRDYFAAKAMQGLFSLGRSVLQATSGDRMIKDFVAEQAYEIADAMLKERAK